MPVSERPTERAVARKSGAESDGGLSPTTSAADLTPTEAWSRRVRWIGGLIQAAFAAFWLLRGSRVIGGGVAVLLIAVFGVVVIGVFFYAITATRGVAPRPTSPEGKRIERAVTIATVIEFAAAIILPVIVSSAGHSDWVLPSIAITIGPLLLWLDGRVNIPRYRPVGWALTVGPVILVVALSGTALVATTGIAAGVLLLGTAVAGFRDLAGVRRAAERAKASKVAFSAGVPAMSEDRLHVVFGAGQVGRALGARLAGLGLPVRVISRSRPAELAQGAVWRAADVTEPAAAAEASQGASVVYQCLNAPYTDWPKRFPRCSEAC